MNSDPEAFRRLYLPGIALPLPMDAGWRLNRLQEDRVQCAVVLELQDGRGEKVLAFVEPRVEGRRSLAATGRLALSYYRPGREVDERALAVALRGLAVRLSSREKELSAPDVDTIFRQGPSSGHRFKDLAGHPVELRINRECNEACVFCNTPPDSDALLAGREQVLSEMRRLFDLGHRAVTFTGREPTLDPALSEYVGTARAMGYTDVRLQTNGTTLSSAGLLSRLVAAGLGRVQISLHTLREETFRQLVGEPRLLGKTRAGLANALAVPGLVCEVLCVVTSRNVDELEELAAALAAWHRGKGLELVFSPMAPQGCGEGHPELLPRLKELGPALGRALAVTRDAGIAVRIPHRCGLPLCATPPAFRDRNMSIYAEPGDDLEAGKAKGPRCRDCAFDDRCVGVWKAYLDRFGDEELTPLA